MPIGSFAASGADADLEPTTGIEPVNLFLTKEVLYLLSYVGSTRAEYNSATVRLVILWSSLVTSSRRDLKWHRNLERETGLEPATFSLEG